MEPVSRMLRTDVGKVLALRCIYGLPVGGTRPIGSNAGALLVKLTLHHSAGINKERHTIQSNRQPLAAQSSLMNDDTCSSNRIQCFNSLHSYLMTMLQLAAEKPH